METAFRILEQYIEILMLIGLSKQTAAVVVFFSFIVFLHFALEYLEIFLEKEIEK